MGEILFKFRCLSIKPVYGFWSWCRTNFPFTVIVERSKIIIKMSFFVVKEINSVDILNFGLINGVWSKGIFADRGVIIDYKKRDSKKGLKITLSDKRVAENLIEAVRKMAR